MRIALFSDTFPPQVNGVAFTLQRLANYMEGRGISYEIFAPGPGEEKEPQEKIYRFASMPLAFYPECRMALPRYFFIRKQLQRFQPDLIHTATPFNLGLCGHYYGSKYDVPLVASYHTHFDRYLRYYGAAFATRIFWRYIRWFHQGCQMTLVPSEETRDHILQHGIHNVELWKRGIDCQQFSPQKRTPLLREKYGIERRFIFLYAGRLAPEKDLDILKEVMAILPTDLSQHLHWIICGDGPLLDDLQREAPPHVTYTGFLPQKELAELYATADLFFFPSSTETFGNVVLEAMASGLPVIGAKAGGVKELIQEGETGFLCLPRTSSSFAYAIEQFITQPNRMESMGKKARQFALTQSWDSIFTGLFEKYEKVIFQCHKSSGQNIFSA